MRSSASGRLLLRKHLKRAGPALLYSDHLGRLRWRGHVPPRLAMGLEASSRSASRSRYKAGLPELGEGEEPGL